MDTTENIPGIRETVKLRIEMFFKPLDFKLTPKKMILTPIQGQPLNIYLKITNISDYIFKGAMIHSAMIHNRTSNTAIKTYKNVQIPSLNPGEVKDVLLDRTTFVVDGAYWASFDLKPELDTQEVLTYQYDVIHKVDDVYKINKWGNIVFVEGKLASLQTTTNHYILALTAITVWEAIFGIKTSLQWLFLMMSKLLLVMSTIFSSLSNIA